MRAGVVLFAFVAGLAYAASPVDVYQFEDDGQRQRYRALIEEFRCPKCLNTNIAGSDAPIAQDLRRTVHRLVVQEGYSDKQVRDFLQARYGDFVLYDPPFNARTYLIWLVPVGLGMLALAVLSLLWRRAQVGDSDDPHGDLQRKAAEFLQEQ